MQRTIPREVSIAWLSGIIDGEGTIGCYFYHDKRGNYKSPRYGIWIVNADQRIISKCVQLFKMIGAEKVFTGEKKYKKGLGKLRCWYIQVNRKEDVKKMLESITPYLISKKEQAELILKFFKDYPNLLLNRGNRSGKKNENYAVYNRLINKIKQAKKKIGMPVETKR